MKPVVFLAFANDKEVYALSRRLNLADEQNEISKVLQAKALEKDLLMPFNKADFLRIFAEKGKDFQIFHYGGHGGKDTLFFENFDDNEKINAEYLLEYLASFDLKLIFLNACDTYSVAANLFADPTQSANKFAATVICTKGKIDDSVAVEFAKNFYLHLTNGCSIQESFEKAKNAQKMTENRSKSPNDWHLLGENTDWKLIQNQIDMLAETLLSGLLSMYESGGAEFLKSVGTEFAKGLATDTLKKLGGKVVDFFKGKPEEDTLDALENAISKKDAQKLKTKSETVLQLLKNAVGTDPDFRKEVEDIINGLNEKNKAELAETSGRIMKNIANIKGDGNIVIQGNSGKVHIGDKIDKQFKIKGNYYEAKEDKDE